MKIILDECLPRRLLRDLRPHTATTVPREGWAGVKNGELLKLVSPEFDVFITIDSNLVHQHNLEAIDLCVVILHAQDSRYETIQPMVSDILEAITNAGPGKIVHLSN